MTAFPVDRYGLIRRPSALAFDISDDELCAAVRRGALLRLTPGVYVPNSKAFDDAKGREELFRLRSIAVATSSADHALPLSHTSAAAVHRLPTLSPDHRRVHVTTTDGRGGGIRSNRHVHQSTLRDDEVVSVDGIAVTSLARTAVDVATMGSFAQALTVFDSSLRRGADRDTMRDALAVRRRGVRPARRAIELADGESESVGESWSRAQILTAGLPRPRVQQWVRGISGREYRCDFGLGPRLVAEFDGKIKYGRLLRPGEDIADVILREKAREDDIRAAGYMMLRWTWPTLHDGSLLGILRPWRSHMHQPTTVSSTPRRSTLG